MINKELPFTGYKPYRLVNDGYHDQEVLLHELANSEEMQRQWDLIVFDHFDGPGRAVPKASLSPIEKKIVGSVIQWLGTPVGNYFLSQAGFERKKE